MPADIYSLYPFIHNDAFRAMVCIIEGARGRLKIPCQTEEHHIIPRSLDKSIIKDPTNLVHLIFREHFRVHMLLPDCVPEGPHRDSMIRAAWMMSHTRTNNEIKIITNPIEYENLKSQFRKTLQGRIVSDLTRAKISKANLGRTRTPAVVEAIRQRTLGKKRSPATIQRLRESSTGRKQSEASKKKISLANSGKKRSIEVRRQMCLSRIGQPRRQPEGWTHSMQTRNRWAKWWRAVSPENQTFIFQNLSAFCKERKLDHHQMRHVAYGKRKWYKGWTCETITPQEVSSHSHLESNAAIVSSPGNIPTPLDDLTNVVQPELPHVQNMMHGED